MCLLTLHFKAIELHDKNSKSIKFMIIALFHITNISTGDLREVTNQLKLKVSIGDDITHIEMKNCSHKIVLDKFQYFHIQVSVYIHIYIYNFIIVIAFHFHCYVHLIGSS